MVQSQRNLSSTIPGDASSIYTALHNVYSNEIQRDIHSSSSQKILPSSTCTCRSVNQTTVTGTLSFVHFRKVFRRYHYHRCPKSKTSETSLEYVMTILPPVWLLGHTINLSMAFRSWGSTGGWSISPTLLTSRVVDSSQSPAFQAIRHTWKLLDSTGAKEVHIRLKILENTTEDLFQNNQASARDEDCHANTLLSVRDATNVNLPSTDISTGSSRYTLV